MLPVVRDDRPTGEGTATLDRVNEDQLFLVFQSHLLDNETRRNSGAGHGKREWYAVVERNHLQCIENIGDLLDDL